MKKIIIILSFLIPVLAFGQARVLVGQSTDGQTLGKKIKDTVRSLKAESPIFIIDGGSSYVDTARLIRDTSALFVFGGGGGNVGDTATFTPSTIYGAVYNSTSDTMIITQMQIGLQGSSPSVTVRIYWNDSLNITAGATALTASGTAATNTATGTTVTSFANTKIPPGVWVWCVTPAVTTKPTFMSVTLIGYKKQRF